MYVTLADLAERFGAKELVRATNSRTANAVAPEDLQAFIDGDPSPSEDVVTVATVVGAAIEDAEALANSFLESLYVIPALDADGKPPLALVRVCADVARHELLAISPPAVVRQRYEDALAWLRDVSRGRVSLGLDADDDATPRRGAPSTATRASLASRVFSEESEGRFFDPTL